MLDRNRTMRAKFCKTTDILLHVLMQFLLFFLCVAVQADSTLLGKQAIIKTAAPEGLSISIHTIKDNFMIDEIIPVEVVVSNQSKEVLHIVSIRDRPAFKLEIKNAQGLVMPLTRYGKSQNGLGMGDDVFATALSPPKLVDLAVGKDIRFTLPLNRLVDMSEAGSYAIVFRTSFVSATNKTLVEVASNTLAIDITEKVPFTTVPVPRVEQEAQEPTLPNFQWTKSPSASWELGDSWTLSVQILLSKPPDNSSP